MPIIIETERLVIREITPDDAPFVLELLNTPKFIKYIADRGVRTIEDALRYIDERFSSGYVANGYGLYAVELKGEGQVVGTCGFVRRDTLPGPDIGFALLPEFEGKGYGFESASAVMRYGLGTLGFDRVLAITSLDNDKSGRLLEKLGFKFDEIRQLGKEALKVYVFDGNAERSEYQL
ncbi:MAG TPA: GNAT family N-acetyltransferase [Pyrinomonadaceae bacterium]|nr:GNAT family N-acetyltransferase [Pyrinomonadaceae bacterium]